MPELPVVSVVGGRGYVGGELLRLLLGHPGVTLGQVTSTSHGGRPVTGDHPNLRGVTALMYTKPGDLETCDLLILAQPHGKSAGEMDHWSERAPRIIDCSADFRLRDPETYRHWYGQEHPAPEWLEKFVYGLPERFRRPISTANYVSGVGCNATVTNLALAPLSDAGLLDMVVADIKVASSEAGAVPGPGSHHPERSGAVRSYKPTGHRHQAEVEMVLGGGFEFHISVTAVELVRGALVTAHCFLKEAVDDRRIWSIYRQAYSAEPFIRLVKQARGLYRYPEPKLLAGTNWCDIGFEVDREAGGRRLVVIAALDNLMKGAAGNAVQAMNCMLGLDERTGLGFPGLHPL